MDGRRTTTDQPIPSPLDSVASSMRRNVPPTIPKADGNRPGYQLEHPELSVSRKSSTVASDGDSKLHSSKPTLLVLLAFTALSLSIFLVALDTVLIPTALPTIALSFHIPDSLYAWVGSAYLLANAASVPSWGKLSDVFGRKPIILTADVIFLCGSIICGVSGSATTLIAGRIVQGLGGGGVVVLVHICVSDLFSIR